MFSHSHFHSQVIRIQFVLVRPPFVWTSTTASWAPRKVWENENVPPAMPKLLSLLLLHALFKVFFLLVLWLLLLFLKSCCCVDYYLQLFFVVLTTHIHMQSSNKYAYYVWKVMRKIVDEFTKGVPLRTGRNLL